LGFSRQSLNRILVYSVAVVSLLIATCGSWNLEPLSVELQKVQDLASHVAYARAFWSEPGLFPYTREFEEQALSMAMGTPIKDTPPNLWTPVSFVILLPLVLLSLTSFAVVHKFFVLLSVLAWLCVVARFAHQRTIAIGSAILLMTPLVQNMLVIGQTSLVAGAALFFLGSTSSLLATGALFAFLSIKPPYAFLATVVMLHRKNRRELVSVGVLILVCITFFSLWSGKGWASDYLHHLSNFSQGDPEKNFPFSFEQNSILTIGSVWRRFIGGDTLFFPALSILCMLASLLLAALPRRFSRSRRVAFPLAYFSVLCLPPYMGWYEDVLAVVPLFYLIELLKSRLHRILVFSIFSILFFRPFLLTPVEAMLFLILKLSLLGLWLIMSLKCRPEDIKVKSQPQ
jgi:hypothetical protein